MYTTDHFPVILYKIQIQLGILVYQMVYIQWGLEIHRISSIEMELALATCSLIPSAWDFHDTIKMSPGS